MTVNLQKSLLPPTERKAKLCQWRKYILRTEGGGEFKLSAAEMFSFHPNPTRTKDAWPSSICLLYGSYYWIFVSLPFQITREKSD